MKHNARPAFTLFELILSISVIAMLALVSVQASLSMQRSNELEIASETYAQVLHRAQSNARASKANSIWGVRIQTGQVILFAGNSYATRNTTYDEIYTISSRVSISGSNEYTFSRWSGLPVSTGTTTLSANTQSNAIQLNSMGTVNY